MRSQHKKFLVILLASFWLCFSPQLIDFLALPASASIHQQGIIRENGSSINNFKDETGNVWELIVWQEANNENSDIYLRLVGYPLFQLDHDRPLQFGDRNRVLFEAKDLYTSKTPAFHVAKYSIKNILPQLSSVESLDLSFYLISDRRIHLKIPPEVIAQWQEYTKTKLKSDRDSLLHKTSFLLAQNPTPTSIFNLTLNLY